MTPVSNWRQVLRHAWSVRLNALAAVLTGAEVVIQIFIDSPPVSRGLFALLALATSLAASASRFIAQRAVSDNGQ